MRSAKLALILIVGASVTGNASTGCYSLFVDQDECFGLTIEHRYRLRPLRSGDFENLKQILQDPEAEEMSGEMYTDSVLRRYIQKRPTRTKLLNQPDSLVWINLNWGIEDTQVSDELVGFTYLGGELLAGRACTGYVIKRSRWGEGIATQTVKALVRFGFERLDLKMIEADALQTNSRSIRVLQKAGFRKTGQELFMGDTLSSQGLLQYNFEVRAAPGKF